MKILRFIFYFVFFLIFSFLTSLSSQARLKAQQPGIHFGYDVSGNRISRTITLSSQQSAPNRANTSARNFEEKNNNDSIVEDDFFVNIPENNEILDVFYTDKLNESEVVIYPNPTRGALAVEIRNKNFEIPHRLTVFNLNGAIVFEHSNISNYTEINLFSQPIGMYFLRIFSGDTFITWKIIKE